MESIRALDPRTIDEYRGAKETLAPTGVSISIIDVRSPAVLMDGSTNPGPYGIHSHWCWGHLLLDGHHKVRAASLTGRPLTLLSFTAIGEGVARRNEIEQLVELLR